MSKKVVTRRELLDRWRAIEEEDDDENVFDDSKQRHIQHLKETWFSDAFNFLIYLSKDNHIWCGNWDIMGPLLETFYNFFKDTRQDSPLKLLWKRISEELQDCMQCICQHHQAKDTYAMEYELSSIGPLLDVLSRLDEERVTNQLKEMNTRISQGKYDPVKDSAKVITVMYEVLMFPVLLDDQSLVTEFQVFIEAVDDSHELTLAGHQQYPGVYALLFLKTRRCRSIGFRLAGYMGKLRNASDLEPLQPLLKKCISFIETESIPVNSESSRPRIQLDRITVWLGIKALLGFLEPHAFEEGILERNPSFLNIVLNHICDDSIEFSYAINCLRLLFDMLGCKLWLRATLSPSVMRDTLLGQCFHTQDEKSHKEIFDLFPPFLQSLEALQDEEHKKQRRHFLYFLLHQVTVSSNFSTLMRKKACQIAILIIHRGYKMNPSCPPFECAHMWGPSLVASLKDSSLYSALRQPAIDLIQTIIISDASALVSSILHSQIHKSVDKNVIDFKDEEENEGLFPDNVEEEKDTSCWNGFSQQSQTTSSEYGTWMCISMLWFDVLVEIDPVVLPVSFSKAVLWGLSRFSMVEPETSADMALPVGNWLTTRAPEVTCLFGWKTPSGADDGGDGKESKNSVKVLAMCIPLIRTFRRLTSHFITRMEQGELRKQWSWEPRMSETLILLLVDPDDYARQVGRRILEQVSNTRGLLSCLQFLCSSSASISAVFLGLKHARELILLDSVLQKFQSLHHFFFVLCKILTEGVQSGKSEGDNSNSKFSSQGGFLQHPTFDSLTTNTDGNLSKVNSEHWKKFSFLLSEVVWPSFCICLSEGKTFIDYKISQMTCIRLLECLPVVLQKLQQSLNITPGDPNILVTNSTGYKWLHDLMYWGKSTLTVVVRYWKQTVISLLDLLKDSCHDKTADIIAIEKLIQSEDVSIDELSKQVSHLSVSLKKEANVQKTNFNSTVLLHKTKSSTEKVETEDLDLQILDSNFGSKSDKESVIILSDDETDVKDSVETVSVSHGDSSLHDEARVSKTAEKASELNAVNKNISVDNEAPFVETSIPKAKSVQSKSKGKSSDIQKKSTLTKSLSEKLTSKMDTSAPYQRASSLKNIPDETRVSKSTDNQVIKKIPPKSDNKVIKELVFDAKDDPWEFALKSARHHQSHLAKLSGPKRQVIQLNMPFENKASQLNKRTGQQRFKPLRLDDWFRPILEMDYFATVGLVSSTSEKTQTNEKLQQVPIHFQSPDAYVAVFRPLVLEELKAQLHSSFMELTSPDEMSCGNLSVMSVERVDDFHVVRCVHDDKDLEGSRTCVENDLVLLTRHPFQKSFNDVHMVGKVERLEKDYKRKSSILMIKFYLQNGSSRLNRAKKFLMERSKWYIHRIMSITSQLREFQALSSVHSTPLLSTILNPNNQPKILKSKTNLSKLSPPLQKVLESSFNDPQLQAISTITRHMDLRNDNDHDLSLIQGPPGTGKTRTIVAIVSALLSLTKVNTGRTTESDVSRPTNKGQMSQTAAIARAWQDAALAKQMQDVEDKNSRHSNGGPTGGRVLICAQSNAAVDELVSRISSHGLYGNDGKMYKPYLVRVGNSKTVHQNSIPFFIDTLVDQRLTEEESNITDAKSDDVDSQSSNVLRSKLEKLADRIKFLEAKRANMSNGNPDSKNVLEGDADVDVKEMSEVEIGAKLRLLYNEKKSVYVELSAAQSREKKSYEKRKALKAKLRKSILKEAEIVITTLSGCGGDLYSVCSESMSAHKFSTSSESSLFDAVVIDEAAQALEPATLIPLQLLKSKGSKSIMVGDPKQLPATVLSDVASKYRYECSMFERLQKAGHPVTMLTKQYRMHPEICRFPSLHFYDGNLLNGDGMSNKEKPFHKTQGLGPYLFYDIVDGQELNGKNSGSLYNECEADAAVELLRFFRKSYPMEFVGGRIGIITPYRSQLSLLRSRFSSAFGSQILEEMELNTVDGFQGREVDILVVSTVRASGQSSGTIGFVADVRRMNVALTRAKHSLWILGNVRTLQTNKNWGALVNDAKQRNLVLSVKKPYASMFNSLNSNHVPDSSHDVSREIKHMKNRNKVNRHENNNSFESKRRHSDSLGLVDDNDKAKKKAKKEYDSTSKKGNGEDEVRHPKGGEKQGDDKIRNMDVDKAPLNKSSQHEEGSKKSSQPVVDPICKRKQQREAVEALLPSGFISSKKGGGSSSSLKSVPPVRKSRPPLIKPTKTKKG